MIHLAIYWPSNPLPPKTFHQRMAWQRPGYYTPFGHCQARICWPQHSVALNFHHFFEDFGSSLTAWCPHCCYWPASSSQIVVIYSRGLSNREDQSTKPFDRRDWATLYRLLDDLLQQLPLPYLLHLSLWNLSRGLGAEFLLLPLLLQICQLQSQITMWSAWWITKSNLFWRTSSKGDLWIFLLFFQSVWPGPLLCHRSTIPHVIGHLISCNHRHFHSILFAFSASWGDLQTWSHPIQSLPSP